MNVETSQNLVLKQNGSAEEDSDDISFIVENVTFSASKSRLVSVSDYFKAMLLSNFQESVKRSITLSGVDAEAFGLVLRWASVASHPASFGKRRLISLFILSQLYFVIRN